MAKRSPKTSASRDASGKARQRAAPRRRTASRKPGDRRWSRRVTETSDALDLRQGVFTLDDPDAIARSLLRSARRSRRRKSDPHRSAMSMLTFYINRAGSQLSRRRRGILERAKDSLRAIRSAQGRRNAPVRTRRRS